MSRTLRDALALILVVLFLTAVFGLALSPDPGIQAVGMTILALIIIIGTAVLALIVLGGIGWLLWVGIKEQQQMNADKRAAEQVEA